MDTAFKIYITITGYYKKYLNTKIIGPLTTDMYYMYTYIVIIY